MIFYKVISAMVLYSNTIFASVDSRNIFDGLVNKMKNYCEPKEIKFRIEYDSRLGILHLPNNSIACQILCQLNVGDPLKRGFEVEIGNPSQEIDDFAKQQKMNALENLPLGGNLNAPVLLKLLSKQEVTRKIAIRIKLNPNLSFISLVDFFKENTNKKILICVGSNHGDFGPVPYFSSMDREALDHLEERVIAVGLSKIKELKNKKLKS